MEKSVTTKKVHKWRLCPYGEHWVKEHSKTIKEKEYVWSGHCALNPSGKDQLYPEEILEIEKKYFNRIKGGPSIAPSIASWKFENRDKYDHLIKGWTRYWNDVFESADPLDPDFVKALIASESSFEEGAINKNGARSSARGLTQLIDQTIKVLGDDKGELKDHFVIITHEQALNPSLNICAAVRWLFRKKETASARLKRAATWDEVMMEYKAVLSKKVNGKPYNKNISKTFNKRLRELKRGK
jgi:hypothetical protein